MSFIINAITVKNLFECISKAEANTKKSEAYKEEYLEIIKEFIKKLESEVNEKIK